jgi:adenylate cyclase
VRARLDCWDEALAAYRARDFAGALERFAGLGQEDVSTTLYALFAARCRVYIAAPPPDDWDGATSMTEK